jgi:hypothetical protein
MRIDLSTPARSICVHPVLGVGILRTNTRVQTFGTHVRLIQVAFPDISEWQYLPESEEFLEILPPTNCPTIGSA